MAVDGGQASPRLTWAFVTSGRSRDPLRSASQAENAGSIPVTRSRSNSLVRDIDAVISGPLASGLSGIHPALASPDCGRPSLRSAATPSERGRSIRRLSGSLVDRWVNGARPTTTCLSFSSAASPTLKSASAPSHQQPLIPSDRTSRAPPPRTTGTRSGSRTARPGGERQVPSRSDRRPRFADAPSLRVSAVRAVPHRPRVTSRRR